MGLISYTNIEDDEPATGNLWNSRFAKIHDEINGNLTSANLANGAVTTAKIADGAVTSSKIATSKYVDDNGWTVLDLGGNKTYTRVLTVDGTTPDGNGGTGYLIGGGGTRRDLGIFPPPVGRTANNITITATYFGQYSGHLVVSGEIVSGSSIMIAGGNIWPAQLSYRGKVFVQAAEQL